MFPRQNAQITAPVMELVTQMENAVAVQHIPAKIARKKYQIIVTVKELIMKQMELVHAMQDILVLLARLIVHCVRKMVEYAIQRAESVIVNQILMVYIVKNVNKIGTQLVHAIRIAHLQLAVHTENVMRPTDYLVFAMKVF
jgi:hypothetical protein